MMDFPVYNSLVDHAHRLLEVLKGADLKLATAESCTGGLISAILTEVPGSSDVVERGFVTYSNMAKTEMLGVPASLIADLGAVSGPVAEAMACGALDNSKADLSVSVTGIAGPSGGSPEKPVGLVFIATASRGGATAVQEFRFGENGRSAIRIASVNAAFDAVWHMLGQ